MIDNYLLGAWEANAQSIPATGILDIQMRERRTVGGMVMYEAYEVSPSPADLSKLVPPASAFPSPTL